MGVGDDGCHGPRRPLPYRNGRRLGVEAEQQAGQCQSARHRHETHPSRQRLGPNTRGSLLSRPISLFLFVVLFAADSRSQAPSCASCELLHVRCCIPSQLRRCTPRTLAPRHLTCKAPRRHRHRAESCAQWSRPRTHSRMLAVSLCGRAKQGAVIGSVTRRES